MKVKPIPPISDKNREYFEGTAQGELRIRTCRACGALFRFAHIWCPACWSHDLSWQRASGQAKVTHFTVVHQAPSPAFAADGPYVLALVRLEEGVRMMTNIVGCDPQSVHIGLDVTVAFEERGDVRLPVFTPRRAG